MKAFLFPGQGSQEIGMAHDLFRDDSYFRSLVSYAGEITHEDLEKLCLKGPDRKLMQARYLQPLLVAVSLGYLRRLLQTGVTADYVLGHSLGEITALAAAGVVSDMDALVIAAKRGELMDSAAAVCNGGMLAIIFMPLEKIEELIDEFNEPQRLVLANDNAPDQIVLSGDLELLDKMAQLISDRQLGKTKKVLVAGPWHSPYMKSAREEFERWAEPLKFKRPLIPIVLNATSKPEEHTTTIKHLVTWQLTSPVYWRESMNYLRNAGINTLYEIGPGRILSGLARVNGFKKETRIFNINNLRGIELTRIPDHPVPSTEPA